MAVFETDFKTVNSEVDQTKIEDIKIDMIDKKLQKKLDSKKRQLERGETRGGYEWRLSNFNYSL